MKETVFLPPELRAQVESVGGIVGTDDVDTFGRLRQIEDRSHKLRTILQAWEKQHNEERELRKFYAKKLLVALFCQLGIVNTVTLFVGWGLLILPETVVNTFLVSVFGEVAAMTFIVTKYLFPKTGSEVLDLIEKL